MVIRGGRNHTSAWLASHLKMTGREDDENVEASRLRRLELVDLKKWQ